ncbi:MAG: hypothetical protein ACPG5W_11710, partial [Flavobacteriales bacterium]
MQFIRANKDIFAFLLKLGVLCGFYFYWFSPNVWQIPVISTLYGYFVHYVLLLLAEPAATILTAVGFETYVFND